jgi:hypothetical protein
LDAYADGNSPYRVVSKISICIRWISLQHPWRQLRLIFRSRAPDFDSFGYLLFRSFYKAGL